MPPKTATEANLSTFKFFTGAVKAYVQKDAGGEDQYFIEGLASSNVRDRQGDTITAQAQAQMLEQAKGLAMFLNHDYDVPEDVAGACDQTHLEAKGDILDLAIKMRIAQSNERAMKSWRLVHDDKITLGFSIGGRITEAEIDEENDDGSSWWPPLIINGMELFEISLVGIPANPRAYTRSFVEDIARSTFKNATREHAVKGALLKSLGIASVGEDPTTEAPTGKTYAKERLDPSVRAIDGTAYFAHVRETYGDGDGVVECSVPHDFDVLAFSRQYSEAKAAAGEVSLGLTLLVDAAPVVEDPRSAEVTIQQGERSITVKAHGTDANDVVAAIRAQLETGADTALEQQLSQRDALVDEIASLTSERESLTSENDALRKTLAELKATPTGRQTKTATSGGSSGNTAAILGVDPSTLTADELRLLKQRLERGELATDARSHAQQ